MLDIFKDCELNGIEYWLVIRLYIAASIPVILSSYYLIRKKVSLSVALTLISAFLITAFGWELWLTYGLAGGLPVDQRRSAMLTCAIPVNLNWFLNSLGEVLVVWIGLFLVYQFKTYDSDDLSNISSNKKFLCILVNFV